MNHIVWRIYKFIYLFLRHDEPVVHFVYNIKYHFFLNKKFSTGKNEHGFASFMRYCESNLYTESRRKLTQ